ncbi:MAG: SURF1 family protein [Actinomycetota bacterium]|nr:SURF1 family protein [Actinomycetota bacterium]
MLQTMLKPRWLGLLALLLTLLVAFTVLGLWQLSVARDDALQTAVDTAAAQPVVPVSQLLAPHDEFPATASGRPVTATGHYDASGQVLVANRRLDDVSGWWVVTPLVVADSGARLAVLRGFVRDLSAGPTGPAPTGSGDVTVTGTLAPGESPISASTGLPAGQLPSLDLAYLVNAWPGPIYNAFVFAQSESPDLTGAGAGVQRVPPPPVPSGLSLRNAAYAVQWWVFGAFAAWMWWRMVREDHLRDRFLLGRQPSRVLDTTDERTAGAPTS